MDIVAENIQKDYYGHLALNDFSVEFKSGEISGLLGPNGAGKTTFIRILNQILQVDRGKLTIDGDKLQQQHTSDMGYLPEERGLYKKMPVLDQIIYLARLKGMSKQDAKEAAEKWLKKLDLLQWKKARIESLSKGMAQKVQFIITVIHAPSILILDEPFSGFDPINTELIKNEILNFKKEGKTIILATHSMNSVEELCDQVVLLNKGRKLLDGTMTHVKAKFRPNIFEIQFKGNIIGFTNSLWAGYELLERNQIDNDRFIVRIKMLNDNTLNDLLKTVLPEVKIERAEEVLPNMNEIFIKAVKENQVYA